MLRVWQFAAICKFWLKVLIIGERHFVFKLRSLLSFVCLKWFGLDVRFVSTLEIVFCFPVPIDLVLDRSHLMSDDGQATFLLIWFKRDLIIIQTQLWATCGIFSRITPLLCYSCFWNIVNSCWNIDKNFRQTFANAFLKNLQLNLCVLQAVRIKANPLKSTLKTNIKHQVVKGWEKICQSTPKVPFSLKSVCDVWRTFLPLGKSLANSNWLSKWSDWQHLKKEKRIMFILFFALSSNKLWNCHHVSLLFGARVRERLLSG